jgi:hypothetical protein
MDGFDIKQGRVFRPKKLQKIGSTSDIGQYDNNSLVILYLTLASMGVTFHLPGNL